MSSPKVYTIAAGLPFVDVLVAGIQDRLGDDPVELANVKVLVPTQRSRRSLAEAFLRLNEGRALLLPRIIALGDMDEDEVLFNENARDPQIFSGKKALEIPEALVGLERQLMLTKLVLARKDMAPDQALNLGIELARLLDQVHKAVSYTHLTLPTI